MKWHHYLVIAVVAIASVVAYAVVFGEWLPNVPVLSPAAPRLKGAA